MVMPMLLIKICFWSSNAVHVFEGVQGVLLSAGSVVVHIFEGAGGVDGVQLAHGLW